MNRERKGMDKEREGGNGYRERVSPIRDAQALGVLNREFRVSVCYIEISC